MINLDIKGIYFIYDPSRPLPRKITSDKKFLHSVFPYLSFIQLRGSSLKDIELLKEANKLKKLALKYSVKFIVNNRMDIALISGADGIHLGKEDIPLEKARKNFKGIIGASRHTIEGALQSADFGADYIGAGPLFETKTKDTGRKPIGVDNFKKIKDSVDIPVVPVGGINKKNILKLKGFADCVAISSGIQGDTDPAGACRKINSALS